MKTFFIDDFRNPQGADTPKVKHFASNTDAQTAYNNGELAPDEWFSTPDIATVSPLDVTGVVAEGNNNAVTSNGVFEALKDIKWLDEVDSVDVLAEAVSRTSNLAYNQFANFIVKSPMTNAPNNTSNKFGIFAWGRKNDATFCKVIAIDFEGSGLYVNTKNTTWSGWSIVGKDYDAVIAQIQNSINALDTKIDTSIGTVKEHVSYDYSYPHYIPVPFRHGTNEKVFLFGDSITVGSTDDGGQTYYRTPSPWGVCFSAYLTGDMNHYEMDAFGGKKLHQTSAGDGSITSDILSEDLTNYKTIVIQGGTNDAGVSTAEVLATDIDKIANYINSNWSGKNVIICGPVYRFYAPDEAAIQTYRKMYREKCIQYQGANGNNYYFINNEKLLNHAAQYPGLWMDVTHPSLPGSIVLGTNFYKTLTGMECDGIGGCITWSGKYMGADKYPILRFCENLSLLSNGSHSAKIAKSFTNVFHTDITTSVGGLGGTGSSGSINQATKNYIQGNVFNGTVYIELNAGSQACEFDFCSTPTDPELQVVPSWS